MHNITYKVEGDKLVIALDISKKTIATAPPSSTGKTLLVATTAGAIPIAVANDAGLTLALNLMAKRQA